LEHCCGRAGAAASAPAKHSDLVGAKDADESAPHHQVLVFRKVLDGALPIPSRPGIAEIKRRMSAYAGRQPESLYDLIVCWHARRPIPGYSSFRDRLTTDGLTGSVHFTG